MSTVEEMTELTTKVQKAVDLLKARSHISKLLIGLSGGKDSLVLCELIKMAEITNVEYFNMEFLPDLRIQKDLLEYACHRFNIPYERIIKVPSEHFMKSMRGCFFTWYSETAKKDYPDVSRTKIFQTIASEHKGTVVTGVKKTDSYIMKQMINRNVGVCVYPLADWTIKDIFTFMKLRKIDIPSLAKKGCRGVGLADENILFIYENYYDDFLKIEKVFPFIRTSILKYEYFDLKRTLRLA